MKQAWIAIGLLGAALTAAAGERTPVVLELFTSEGCSSCPPADKLLATLDEKQPFADADLIVLSEHVDYWNGGGWKDPYSSRSFSDRQRQYAERLGLESVYTPELVVDGSHEGVGSNAASAKASVSKALEQKKINLALDDITLSGRQIKLHANSGTITAEGPVTLYVALAENRVQSEVRQGENAGKSLTHVAVVKALVSAGSIAGGSKLSKDITIPVPASLNTAGLRVVVFLQADRSRKIVGASQARL